MKKTPYYKLYDKLILICFTIFRH